MNRILSALRHPRRSRRRTCCATNSSATISWPPANLRAERLEARVLLAAQVVTSSLAVVNTSTESPVQFDVSYTTTDPGNAKTTGVHVRVHYRSSELTPDLSAITSSAFPGATIQDSVDTEDFDGNAGTDRFVNLFWFDVDGQFPASADLSITLCTATFTTSTITTLG